MSGIFDQVLSYNPTVLASSLAGSVIYKGTWDAATNSPILANPPAATTKGWYYVVSVAGTQFGIDFAVGDWIISNGTVWQKVDLTDSVSSVFGRTGAIASANGDYTASQITNVPAGTISSTNVQDAINELSTDISTAQNVLDALVTNAESVAITKGQVVYAFGATGNRMSVKLALNTSDATSAKTIGVVLDSSIAAGTTGNIRIAGVVDGLNLGTFTAGDTLYLGATAGSVTSTKPYAPNHMVYVGIVERANNGNGQLYVRIQNGYELDEIHDVQITSAPASGALLVRDATNSLWKAARLTAGTNIAVANADASVTVGVSGIIGSSNGGTGNGFTKFSGPTTSEKTFTLPDASATIHYEGGTIGATTANTGRFTTLTATSTISGSNLSGTNTGDQTISLTGDVTAAGSTGALTTTVGKINGVALIGLGTGILKNSTVTGQPGIAVPSDFPTLNQNTTGTASNVTGTVAVGNGGTGATTLTGYVKGSGTAALTASSTIPNTDVSGLGTMSTQAASSVAITGGSINNTTIGAATPNTGAFTTVTASTPIGTASGGTGVNTTPANGQVLIGNGTGYTANTLTAGSGITITNASGAITIASTGGSGAVSSVSGTANEITSSPTTGAVVLSLPTALTFTGKTVTGGTFSSGAFNGTVGATTPAQGNFTFLFQGTAGAQGLGVGFSGAAGQGFSLRDITNSRTYFFTTETSTGLQINAGANPISLIGSSVAVTGALSASGKITVSQDIQLGNTYSLTWGGPYGAGIPTIAGSTGAGTLSFYPTGSTNGVVASITSTGLNSTAIGATTASTGAFTAVGVSGNVTDVFTATTTASGRTAYFKNNTGYALVDITSSGTNQSSYLNLVPSGTGNGVVQLSGIDKLTISSTGLAVTGALSTTGNITLNNVGRGILVNYTGPTGSAFTSTDDTSGSQFVVFTASSGTTIGSIARVTTTSAVTFNTTSDGRLKENLRDFTDSGRLIDSLKPRVFDWKNSDENGKNVVGFIAQETNAADPIFAHIGAVSVGDEDPETITKQWQRSDSTLIPILVAELKALRQRVAALESN
jgi:hypothetical protein